MMTRSSVLVVEDEQALAELYAVWLGDGYRVQTVESGEAALREINKDADAVLLDRQLPGISGPEVLTEMRNRGVDVPVAIVSSVRADLEIIGMQFDNYLHKPIDRETVTDTVEQLIALSEYDRNEREAFALAEKKATLDEILEPEERAESPAYTKLVEKLETAEGRTALPAHSADDFVECCSSTMGDPLL